MARPLRVEYPGATYHIMSRGVGGMEIFRDDGDRVHLLELIGRVVAAGELEVDAFCLMPNHFHLLAETPRAGLGLIMQRALSQYAGAFNRRHGRAGHLFQRRYKAILVEDGEYFLECSRYIHLNPSRAGLARPAELYPWSSYRNYLGAPAAVDWVRTDRTLSRFEHPGRYRAFVESGRDEKPVSPFERARAGLALGGEAFFEKIRSLALERGKSTSARELPQLRLLNRETDLPGPELVRAAVSEAFKDLSRCRLRGLLIYALRACTGLKSVEIAGFVARTPGAVTHAVRNAGRRLDADPKLRKRYEEVVRRLREAPRL